MAAQKTTKAEKDQEKVLKEAITMLVDVNRITRSLLDECVSIADKVRVIAAIGMNIMRLGNLVKAERQLNSGDRLSAKEALMKKLVEVTSDLEIGE
jgi:hypothetical protein